jgi:hypothetical protein
METYPDIEFELEQMEFSNLLDLSCGIESKKKKCCKKYKKKGKGKGKACKSCPKF